MGVQRAAETTKPVLARPASSWSMTSSENRKLAHKARGSRPRIDACRRASSTAARAAAMLPTAASAIASAAWPTPQQKPLPASAASRARARPRDRGQAPTWCCTSSGPRRCDRSPAAAGHCPPANDRARSAASQAGQGFPGSAGSGRSPGAGCARPRRSLPPRSAGLPAPAGRARCLARVRPRAAPLRGQPAFHRPSDNGHNDKSSNLVGPEVRLDCALTPSWSVYGDLVGPNTMSSSAIDGWGGRAWAWAG
jgi:hypothetical protein